MIPIVYSWEAPFASTVTTEHWVYRWRTGAWVLSDSLGLTSAGSMVTSFAPTNEEIWGWGETKEAALEDLKTTLAFPEEQP